MLPDFARVYLRGDDGRLLADGAVAAVGDTRPAAGGANLHPPHRAEPPHLSLEARAVDAAHDSPPSRTAAISSARRWRPAFEVAEGGPRALRPCVLGKCCGTAENNPGDLAVGIHSCTGNGSATFPIAFEAE